MTLSEMIRNMKPLLPQPNVSDPVGQVAATALANQLSESRTQMSVEFPCTGDPELDAISGINQVLEKLRQDERAAVRVLEYVAQRHKDRLNSLSRMSQLAQLAQRTQPETNVPPPPWTTSGGTAAGPYNFEAKLSNPLFDSPA